MLRRPRATTLLRSTVAAAAVATAMAAPAAPTGAEVGAAGAFAGGEDPAPAVVIDDGAARLNPLDATFAPPGVLDPAPPGAKGVESLRNDGSSGFLPFDARSSDYGAYRFQLVASGSDGDVEVLRPAVVATAAELSRITGMAFSVDPGQVPRPTSVNRFPPGFCGSFGGHACSLFDDADRQVGVIRVGFSTGSPCQQLAAAGQSGGNVGCGGPESVLAEGGTVLHVRGNVWVSPSVRDVNLPHAASIVAHEVGHTLGLDHYSPVFTAVPGRPPVRQLMFPSLQSDPSDTGSVYRSGDANGVQWLHRRDAWFITATYRDFLGRPPDTAGYQFWIEADVSAADYVSSLAGSDEWIGRIVNRFYQDVFGRAADPGGFRHWTEQVRLRGVPFVASQLYGSAEYTARNGGTPAGMVQAMYRQLLGRDPAGDPAGVAFWVGEIGRRGTVDVALSFFQSDEKRRSRVRELYCTLLDRPPDAGGASYWAGVILTQGDIALARNLATSGEYLAAADEASLRALDAPPPPGC